MNDGKIEQIGVPNALYNRPETVFTAQFIGSPPMNLLPSNEHLIGVRPEHIEIKEEGTAAQVISCDYHGADTIVLVDVKREGGKTATVKLRHPGHALFEAGQAISISWKPENEHRFPCLP